MASLVGAIDEALSRSNVCRLRGLPFSSTEDDVVEFFKGLDLGPNGVMMCYNPGGRATGQAYVEFDSADTANKALERNKNHIGTRYIEVFKAHYSDLESAKRSSGGSLAPSSGSLNGGIGTAGAGLVSTFGNPDHRYSGVLRLRGLPYSTSVADIEQFFKGLALAPDGIHICSHADGRPTGEAYVEFIDEESATNALKLHKEPIGTRYVELFRTTKGEMLTVMQPKTTYSVPTPGYATFGQTVQVPNMMGGYVPGMPAVPQMGPIAASMQSGLQTGMQQMVDASSAENVCIKLRGLPFNAGEREILEFFQGYDVAQNGVHLVLSHTERPSGEAYVEFTSVEEATRAMERQRQNIGSRYIELFRVTKTEMLLALGATGQFGLGQAATMDPNMLLLMQQQAAAAAGYGMATGMMGSQGSAWGMGDLGVAAGFYAGGQLSPTTAAPQMGAAVKQPSSTLRMRGLPFRATSADIVEFFEGYDFVEESIKLGAALDGRATGEAWVKFGSQEEAQRALRERNRANMGSRYIELFVA